MTSKKLMPGVPMPDITVSGRDGGALQLGKLKDGTCWKIVTIYRGKFCPVCKIYLSELQGLTARLAELGVDIVALSADNRETADAFAEELGLTFDIGHGLTSEQAEQLGLYRTVLQLPGEAERIIAEPALFVINEDEDIYTVMIGNCPTARPDLNALMLGIEAVLAQGRPLPIRGTYRP